MNVNNNLNYLLKEPDVKYQFSLIVKFRNALSINNKEDMEKIFIDAVKRNYMNSVRWILEYGRISDTVKTKGLEAAILKANFVAIRLLCSKGVNFNKAISHTCDYLSDEYRQKVLQFHEKLSKEQAVDSNLSADSSSYAGQPEGLSFLAGPPGGPVISEEQEIKQNSAKNKLEKIEEHKKNRQDESCSHSQSREDSSISPLVISQESYVQPQEQYSMRESRLQQLNRLFKSSDRHGASDYIPAADPDHIDHAKYLEWRTLKAENLRRLSSRRH